MITKEELLQKGIDPAVADEILAKLEQSDDSSPLEALNKALAGEVELDLFKAKGEGDDGDGDDEGADYDEEYMKKYMKKYMKANKKEAADAAKEVGLFAGEMKKAVDDISPDSEGAVIEMADLAPLLEAIVPAIENMAKAIVSQNERIEVIAAQNAENYSLLHKAAAVTAETAETISGIASTPQGRKGVIVSDMSKAKPVGISPKLVYTALSKAVSQGDKRAGDIGSKFESGGNRFDLLMPEEQKYVNDLIAKEAN